MKKSGRKQGILTLCFSVLLAITVIFTSIMPVSAKQSQMTMTKEVGSKVAVTLHYYRFDNKYDDWDIWAWAPEGVAFALDSQDEFGKKGTIEFENVSEETPIGFIVRKSDWSQKEGNADRFVDKSKLKSDGTGDIYVIEGIDTVYTTLASAQKAIADLKKPRVTTAKFDSLNTVSFETNQKITKKDKFTIQRYHGVRKIPVKSVKLDKDGMGGTLVLKNNMLPDKTYTLEVQGLNKKEITIGELYNSKNFTKQYTYQGQLGALYEKSKTKFVFWSPTADNVSITFYGKDGKNTEKTTSTLAMKKGKNGVWTATKKGNLDGTYYTYEVTHNKKKQSVVDPYAKAVGVNGTRAMVVNLDSTDPEGFSNEKRPKVENPTDSILYEMHIRDFSIAGNSGVSKENKGKYAGVWEANTTIPNTDVKTGISHLKELGITTVHLLPSFDHQSIDETKLEEAQYNWGYDPKNYNVPEGSYSSDPYDGKTRITEYKKMVQELHKAGISVVMDVVYNHTGATSDSELNKAVPNYYYRQNEKGEFSNGSGCGNETASERAMMRKLMVDSVTYWAKEYHIDGFRFDLMALHDQDTMVAIREALNEINPSILIYGEGWTGGDTPLSSEKQATKANTKNFGELQIAAFSDDIRDGIKGSVFDAKDHGFVDGAQNKEETIKFGIVASTPNDQIDTDKVNNQTKAWAKEPYQTITYESAHDNLTLWDKLQSANETATEQQLLAMNKMSAAIVLTSQGIPFLHAGEEMARTKENADGTLNENSYNAPDSVNAIDWSRKQKYEDLYEYYQGLIAMRKEHKAFHMNSTKEIQDNLKFLDVTEKNVVAYTLNGKAVGDSWNTIAVIFNANNRAVEVTVPDNQWAVVVDQNTAGTKQLKTVSGSKVTVPANSTYVLVDKASIDTVK
ncbi:MAG: type I pullulanase [Clostridiales bacterium]|nr:type I pullulanase [Clostridiales bacterium]